VHSDNGLMAVSAPIIGSFKPIRCRFLRLGSGT
jgi:hypothetical protein